MLANNRMENLVATDDALDAALIDLEAWARKTATENTARFDEEAQAAQIVLTLLDSAEYVIARESELA